MLKVIKGVFPADPGQYELVYSAGAGKIETYPCKFLAWVEEGKNSYITGMDLDPETGNIVIPQHLTYLGLSDRSKEVLDRYREISRKEAFL